MRIIDAGEVASSLAWPALVERLAETFRRGVESPPRHHHAMQRRDGEATLLLMPAWEQDGYIGVKMVNVFPRTLRMACRRSPASTCSARATMGSRWPVSTAAS
ncbi:ornithine cyclodeaminase [Halomonas elongata]|uniref:Ornithine cyclodeaminase n=1 Tax=Halomonas elongata TaxID=2746 RepID=A0A1B8P1F1_HALEL|nr:ornithine cyclodeaminase [Halomonas elongata]